MSTIERALRLACDRIADSPQTYEEARTADDWYEEFIRRAEAESPSEVSGVAYRLHGEAPGGMADVRG